jgi:hypothetical protein
VALIDQADMESQAVVLAETAEYQKEDQRKQHREENCQPVAEVAADADFGEGQNGK